MAQINLNKIAHSYVKRPTGDSDYALKLIDNIWDDGGAYALLGPSGCGKTTLLNIISGLLAPSKGRILFDGKDVTDLPPEKRNIAQVFQFPVLYDTMSVFDNLAFPLRNRGFDEAAVKKRVLEIAAVLDLTTALSKKAAGLAADAKQKISLGRGLVRSDVAAILFDEPLTVIDPNLKWQLRCKLKEIHEQLKLTFIYVTHDQVEALTFADKVVVMYDGEIVQIGTPQELFDNPGHKFVGYFIGSPGMNFIPCKVDGNIAVIQDSKGVMIKNNVLAKSLGIPLNDSLSALALKASGQLELGIRPLYLKAHTTEVQGSLKAKVKALQDHGNFQILTAILAGHTLKARLDEQEFKVAEDVWLEFPFDAIRLFAKERLLK